MINTVSASLLQICANLDSVIVSTENYKMDLKNAVPRPIKNYDIVNERPWVCLYSSRNTYWTIELK